MDTITIDSLSQLAQAPLMVWIGFLLFKLSQQFTSLASKIDVIIELAISEGRIIKRSDGQLTVLRAIHSEGKP